MADWMDDEVEIAEQKLTNGQIFALLRMTEILRRPEVAYAVGIIKLKLGGYIKWGACGSLSESHECWVELSEEEQTALWVAPSFGGVFTTEERKIIKSGFKEANQL